MKKVLKIIVIVLGIFILTGCESNLKRTTYKDLDKMIKDEKTFVLEVSQDGCIHCEEYAPIFNKVLNDNDLKAYNLNITYMSKSDYNKFDEKYDFEGTPTTMFFKDGKELVTERIVGTTTEKKLTKSLKRLGYIK